MKAVWRTYNIGADGFNTIGFYAPDARRRWGCLALTCFGSRL